MWATENIKDTDGNELYFAWGGTQGYTAEQVGYGEGKKKFGLSDYEFGPDTAFTKYNKTDGKTVLDTEDDAATANWGNGWRMPTKEEFEELFANTDYEWTTVNGVQGGKFTSKVDANKFLFFPAVGNAQYGDVLSNGAAGGYWSTYLYDENDEKAWIIAFRDVSRDILTFYRYIGQNVRPVRK